MEEGLVFYSDGGARGNPGPAACAFVVYDGGKIVHKASRFLGKSTNNFAEYQGVIYALTWLMGENTIAGSGSRVVFNLDSELVVKQLNGLYKVKNGVLRKLFLQVDSLIKKIGKKIIFKHIPRSKNKTADLLVNQELDKKI